MVSVKFVIGTYGVASAYVLADTYDKASKVSVQMPWSESAQLIAKGQLISEAIFLGFKSPKKETYQLIRVLYFFDSALFKSKGRNPSKNFATFLGDFKPRKIAS